MHQNVYLEELVDEYFEYQFEDGIDHLGKFYPLLRRMAEKIVRTVVEYADDGSDPMDYTLFGSCQSEFEGNVEFPIEDCMEAK